jgi:2,4-dienoyl-CoA reductase-like NADH-dependent reductase (Old Yellow Enzyme family)
MGSQTYLHLGSVHDVDTFQRHLREHSIAIPCDQQLIDGDSSPLAMPLEVNGRKIGNRFAIHPMEGWDGTVDGKPTELTERRWRNFGRSGAKLIWGGEAVAVRHDGRANPNQLLINEHTRDDIARLRVALIAEHHHKVGSTDDLFVGLQLTHSGRYSQPNMKGRPEPRILYHHPFLDRRVGLNQESQILTDGEVREIIEAFHRAARMAYEIGFDFIDVKHCHGYLGHEFLSAHTREGDYGGSFENRTRFLREVVEGVRAIAPGLDIGVRLSAFDMVPFRPDPTLSLPAKPGAGIPEDYKDALPYRWGFGVDPNNPIEGDPAEATRFLSLLQDLKIRLVNISAGSPYYNPHIQRPTLFPPSDGYLPPEDPLVGVARQMQCARVLKKQFPDLVIVGTAYTYLQEFLPNVAQAAVRENWADSVGLGRMVLAYPELPMHILQGRAPERKRVCRTFSDCTTAPRNGLPSGCYPLDAYYKKSEIGAKLSEIKERQRKKTAEA